MRLERTCWPLEFRHGSPTRDLWSHSLLPSRVERALIGMNERRRFPQPVEKKISEPRPRVQVNSIVQVDVMWSQRRCHSRGKAGSSARIVGLRSGRGGSAPENLSDEG